MPLIGQDMSDEYPRTVGITLVKGYFTTWIEMHRLNFRADPISNLEPRVLGNRDDEDLAERWEQWREDSLYEVREDYPQADISELERVVRWGGVTPFKITDSACYVCAKVGSIIPVIAPMCWPTGDPDPADDRKPWDYQFPAEHLRIEAGLSHDRDYSRHNELVASLWEEELDAGWSPPDSDGDSHKGWSPHDLMEHGFEDECNALEENAFEIQAEECRDVHADLTHIPYGPREAWINVIHAQATAYITRSNMQSRQITYAVAEGFNLWRGATGH